MEEDSLTNRGSEPILVTKDKILPIVEEAVKIRLSEIEKKIEKDRTSILTIFGIFASVIAFLSVQVQILQKATSFSQLVSLSLILIAGLLCFVLALQWITKTWIEDSKKSSLIALVIIIIVLLGGCFFFGYISLKDGNNNTQNLSIKIQNDSLLKK
jgi:cytochrome bd-type quinol oxidase subunit 2